MADTIRDVVIKVALEQIGSTLKMPDMAPLVEAQQQVALQTRQANLAISEESSRLENLTLKANDADAVWIEQVKLKEELTAATEEETRAIWQEIEAANASAGAHEHAAESAHHHEASLLRAARPLNAMIHGTQHLVHATIELSAASEEDAEKMIKRFMEYNAYFSLVTGGIHVIHGLAHAYEVLGEASAAAALEEAAALAPIALIIAAVGTLAYVLHEGFDLFGLKAKAAREELEETEKVWKEFGKREHSISAQQFRGENRIRDEEDALKIKLQHMDAEQQLNLLEERRKETAAEVARQEANGPQFTEVIKEGRERLKDIDEKRLDLLMKMRDAEQAAFDAQERAIAAARQALEIEKQRNAETRQRLGLLNDAEQAELKMIADRVAAGTASFADLKRGAQLDPSHFKGRLDKAAEDRGKDLDEYLDAAVGQDSKKKKLEDDLHAAETGQNEGGDGTTLGEKNKRIAALDKEIREAGKLISEDIKALGEAMREVINDMRKELIEITNEKLGAKNNRKAAHG
jgi:hypothetical protein